MPTLQPNIYIYIYIYILYILYIIYISYIYIYILATEFNDKQWIDHYKEKAFYDYFL